MMRLSLVLLLSAALLAACNQGAGNEPLPTLAVGAGQDAADTQDSPRDEVLPTATILPPTWTPMPHEPTGHLPPGVGSETIPITGTRIVYTVQRGDTLAEICNRYGVSIAEVARINHIDDWDVIEVGQVLDIPVAGN